MKAIDAKHYLLQVKLLRDRVPSFDRYPFSLPAFKELDALTLHPKVTFIIGENGSGKSTLLEAVAVALGINPEGGSRNFAFTTRKSHSDLHETLRLTRGIRRPRDIYFLRAESFFNVATEIERLDQGSGGRPLIDSYGGVSLHEQSHGESFFALFCNRFHASGLYLLDEPEAALSPSRQLAFLCLLDKLVSKNAQFIISTHSPIILAYPEAKIFSLTESGVESVVYQETEHYLLTRDFLNDPEGTVKHLLRKSEES
jgi:predicted ATPase